MNKKKRTQNPKTIQRVVGAALLTIVIIVGVVVWQQSTKTATGLRDSDTAFSISTHVGQPAPKFTATDVDRQPYTVTPGDGHPKAIVFYMGYG